MVPLTGEVFSLPALEFFVELDQFDWDEKPQPTYEGIIFRDHRTVSVRKRVHIGAKYYRGGGRRPLPLIVDLYLLPVPFIVDLYFDPIVNLASEALFR